MLFRISGKIFTVIFFLSTGVSYSQTTSFRFEQFGTKDGLSDQSILSLYEDHQGFLWVGTGYGLNRFDGKTFIPIYLSDSLKKTLYINAIREIAEDAENNLLLQTNRDGIVIFNPRTNAHRDALGDHLAELGNKVSSFLIDHKKNIWVLGIDALIEFDHQFNVIRKWNKKDSFYWLDKNVNWISGGLLLEDHSGNIWLSINSSLNAIDAESGTVYNSKHNPKHWKMFEVTNTGLSEDSLRNLWLTGNNGIYKFNPTQNELKYYPALNEMLLTGGSLILHDGKILLLSKHREFYLFDPATETFQTILAHVSPELPQGLGGCNSFMQDRKGNIWFASDALTRYKIDKNPFHFYEEFGNYFPEAPDIKNAIIQVILVDSNLLIPTANGFFIMNIQTHSLKQYRYAYPDANKKNTFWSVIGLDPQNILVSASDVDNGAHVGLYTINLKIPAINKFLIPHPPLLDTITAVFFFEDYQHQIWIGMWGQYGLFSWNRKTNQFIHYGMEDSGAHHFPFRHFDSAAEDGEGHIWMAYSRGSITCFDYKSERFIELPPPFYNELKNDNIVSMFNDNHGTIWVGTLAGLIQCSLNSQICRRYRRADGLGGEGIWTIDHDNNGIIWMGTEEGISSFNPQTIQFTNFTLKDGLPERSMNSIFFDSTRNKFYVASNTGIIFFDPDSIQKKIEPLYPVITSFKVLGNLRSWKDDSLVNLSAMENSFSFDFSAPNMLNAHDNQYAYMLEGYDKNWIASGTREFVNYTSLPGGNYSFRVKATTDGSHWSEIIKPLQIYVATLFYKTVWFQLSAMFILMLIAATIIYIFYRFRLQRYILSQKLRNKIAGDLHDDIGSTLSSIAIFSELANEEMKDKSGRTTGLLMSINENARTTMESMSDIVWAINPNNDRFENILQRMRTFASGILEAKNIDLKFDASPSLPGLKLSMEKRKNLYLIFKEAVNNVAKYSSSKTCTIKLWLEGKILNMQIEDDGTGFDLNDYAAGNGLANMKRRSEEMQGNLDISSIKEKGTAIHLSFSTT